MTLLRRILFCSVQNKQQSALLMACTQLTGGLHVHLSYHAMKSHVYNILLSFSFWNDNNSNSKWRTRAAPWKAKMCLVIFVCKEKCQCCENQAPLITNWASVCVSASVTACFVLSVLRAVSQSALFNDRQLLHILTSLYSSCYNLRELHSSSATTS